MPKKKSRATTSAKALHERAVHDYRVRSVAGAATARGRIVAAADFKANCLALMDQVQRTGIELVITKRNKPVAKLVPVLDPATMPFIGRSDGMFREVGNLVAPVAPDWDEGADL